MKSSPAEIPVSVRALRNVYRLCVSMLQATLEWENQEDGFLAKILVGDGSKDIPVGTPVAVITEEKGDVSLLHQLHTVVHFCHTQRMA